MIYHIVSKSDWEKAADTDTYRGDTLATEGFIHCSDIDQVIDVANFRFRGRTDLLILTVDPDKLSAPLKYEDGGDGRLFPHIYGPMDKSAVMSVTDFPPQEDGTFVLPPEVG
ncbi:DUF952 domain-containing protein [bacterium]|nr:DUF952 domain-containing protein [bacterium]MCB2179122.1 DUF952 domain-containing protein [bacterium]